MLLIIIALAFVGSSSAAQEKHLFQMYTLPPPVPPFYTPLRDLLRDVDTQSFSCYGSIDQPFTCTLKRDGDQHFINFLGQDFPLGYPLAASKGSDQEDISGTITIDFGRGIFDCGFTGLNPTLNPICIRR
ncbi:uncharacterized protein LOC131936229 [Physella acuta]|uniref:uncharacterized protein LOC131936229 n=1 Tax=Physella acuta TaxID=109671 RepID=UPI0027DCBE99|nr:uncharacterized protein LOC131936229 [Physella acuta]